MKTRYVAMVFTILALLARAPAAAQVVPTVPGQTYVAVVGNDTFGGVCIPELCVSANRGLPLGYFATSASVAALQANVNASLATIGGQTDAILRQLESDEDRNATGIAMAFAMAGTTDLGQGEHIAISGNWGTFQGRNGLAAGLAVRATEHLTFNGGLAFGLNGGDVGGRAGFRVAW